MQSKRGEKEIRKMARRITGIGASALKYAPVGAVALAIYQYYQNAGGLSGFMYDIKNLDMGVLQTQWTKIGMGIAFFVGADVVARYVPGKMRYVAKALMYYFGASQMLDVLNAMYSPAAITSGVVGAEVRGY